MELAYSKSKLDGRGGGQNMNTGFQNLKAVAALLPLRMRYSLMIISILEISRVDGGTMTNLNHAARSFDGARLALRPFRGLGALHKYA